MEHRPTKSVKTVEHLAEAPRVSNGYIQLVRYALPNDRASARECPTNFGQTVEQATKLLVSCQCPEGYFRVYSRNSRARAFLQELLKRWNIMVDSSHN